MALFSSLRRWSRGISQEMLCDLLPSSLSLNCYGEFSAYSVFQTSPYYGVSQASLPSGASEASPGRVTYKHSLRVVEPAFLSVKW